MEEVYQFLKGNQVFYLATAEGDQPRVRPFGAVAIYNGRLYMCTNNTKKVFQQMEINTKVEICSMGADGNWLRIAAKAIPDTSLEAKASMLEENPGLKNIYRVEDGIFEVLYLKEAEATFYSFTEQPRTVTF